MTRFYGVIGYGESVESPPASGKHVLQVSEVPYFGDVLQHNRRLEEGQGVNKNVVVNNRISIVADEFANDHIYQIKYAMWRGVRWTVTNVVVEHPRLILTLGEVYNGPTP